VLKSSEITCDRDHFFQGVSLSHNPSIDTDRLPALPHDLLDVQFLVNAAT
jgi:hypothetical protein